MVLELSGGCKADSCRVALRNTLQFSDTAPPHGNDNPMDANMSLNALGYEKVDQLMTPDEGNNEEPTVDARQGEHQALEESELVNFEATLEETEVQGRTQDRAGNGDEGYQQENRQTGVNEEESDAAHQSAEYEGKTNGRDTIHHSLGTESPSHLTIHIQPFTERPDHAPPTTMTSRGVEGGTLTTALSNVSHAYSPMSDSNINLQNIAAAAREYVADPDAAGYTQYKDASQLPTRRQNVACDACRARKVKCVRKPMAEQVSLAVWGDGRC